MKQLTQAIFKDAPDWVKSAAVDCYGNAYGYGCHSDDLVFDSFHGIWDVTTFIDTQIYLGDDFNADDWKRNTIDREVVK